MIYVKGELTFYDEFKGVITKKKFDMCKENDLKKLLRFVKLKD